MLYALFIGFFFILCISCPEIIWFSVMFFLFVIGIPFTIMYSLFESDDDRLNEGVHNNINSIDDIFDD